MCVGDEPAVAQRKHGERSSNYAKAALPPPQTRENITAKILPRPPGSHCCCRAGITKNQTPRRCLWRPRRGRRSRFSDKLAPESNVNNLRAEASLRTAEIMQHFLFCLAGESPSVLPGRPGGRPRQDWKSHQSDTCRRKHSRV